MGNTQKAQTGRTQSRGHIPFSSSWFSTPAKNNLDTQIQREVPDAEGSPSGREKLGIPEKIESKDSMKRKSSLHTSLPKIIENGEVLSLSGSLTHSKTLDESSTDSKIESKAVSRPKNPMLEMRKPPPFAANVLFNVQLKKVKPVNLDTDSSRETTRKQLKFNKCATSISQIYGNVYISGDKMARDKEKLQESNIKYVLNLAPAVCKNYHPGSFIYKNINLIDSTSESDLLWAFLKSIQFIKQAEEKSSCFVHCHQGVSRSGAVMIAYVMYNENIPFREALESVKAKHSVTSPNAAFIAQLIKFEKRLGVGKSTAYNAEFDEELFLITRQSDRDENLILKPITRDGNSITITNLDPRGTFIIFVTRLVLESKIDKDVFEEFAKTYSFVDQEAGAFFLWQGEQCKSKAKEASAALEYMTLLKELIPRYKNSNIVAVKQKDTLAAKVFFGLLGIAKDNLESSIRIWRNESYDGWFKSFESILNEGSSLPTREKKLSDEELNLVRPEKVSLFHVKIEDAQHTVEALTQYDSADLLDHSAYILQVAVKGGDQAKYFIWLGKNVETVLNEDATVELCDEYIREKLIPDEANRKEEDAELPYKLEKQGQESDDFLFYFEAGL